MELVGWIIFVIWIIAMLGAALGIYILYRIETNEVRNK